MKYCLVSLVVAASLLTGCQMAELEERPPDASQLVHRFAEFTLTTDLSQLTEKEKQMLPLLIDAADIMNSLFLEQAFGPSTLIPELEMTDAQQLYFGMNYGPWDRMNNNRPFVEMVGVKPLGANLYPHDMTKQGFEDALRENPEKEEAFTSLYTLIRRNPQGELIAVPYSEAFASRLETASIRLKAAARLAEDPGLKKYLELRAEALVTDNYQPSDFAWMDMKDNTLDIVIGAIETYEDQLFGYKAGFEAYVLVKDTEWSQRLSRYAELLPDLQRGLPVPDAYKAESPGSNADLNAYDAVYYAGEANAGGKTIAINLPNDEEVQLQKGARRLQLKNTIQAKFEKILAPISEVLIDPEQREHVTFDAFFSNTMFHEVAHGLGIKNTLDGSGTVREALKENYSAIEEGKADVLGLYMILALNDAGELDEGHDVMDNMVTFTASIFRSIRFGFSSAHGRANLMRYNFFKERDAFTRSDDGIYTVNPDQMIEASNELSRVILTFQGDGDYEGVADFVEEYLVVDDELQEDLDRIALAGIPVDITFRQGKDVLGL